MVEKAKSREGNNVKSFILSFRDEDDAESLYYVPSQEERLHGEGQIWAQGVLTGRESVGKMVNDDLKLGSRSGK